MKTRSALLMMLVLSILSFVQPAFAFDSKQFHEDLYSWACINAYLDAVLHPGVPHGSTIGSNLPKMFEELDQVKRRVATAINGLETAEELAKAQAVADEFLAMHGFEKEVGAYVSRLLKERGAFIQTQG